MDKRRAITKIASMLVVTSILVNHYKNTKAHTLELEGIRVGMVTDTGTIYDKSFNQATWEGVERAAKEFNLVSTYLKPTQTTETQYLQAIDNLVNSRYNLIVTPGVRFETTIAKAQEKYKDIKFIIVNTTPKSADGKVKIANNTVAILFAEHEAGFLAGVATALQIKEGAVGFMGGMRMPPVQRFNFGFQQGIKYANDNLGTNIELKPENVRYVGAFNNIELSEKLASEMYDRGVKAIFVAAGQSGIGAINEAKKMAFAGKEAWIIGVDRDQYESGTYLGKKSIVLTSAVINLDDATYDVIKAATQGNFEGGKTLIYSVKNDGVGLPKKNPNLSEDTIKKVNEIYEKIKTGDIKVSSEKGNLLD
ncbi:nucleoside-binding protein [Clostridium cavendishii DSM 21758]|uniref:Nucleoside-binding protein n=1 Tax=Clostridium cavendishii DSM 21758 TaxID=1121302 RepID=A0A1M6IUZ4_9CLOT|nr:BMP family ABC transporter substrate-binding protein [Clostridium cavendishii]SHJ38267.1 nucleoside-binding protein [Clostridium cavendishii DSM 21758]